MKMSGLYLGSYGMEALHRETLGGKIPPHEVVPMHRAWNLGNLGSCAEM